MALTSCSECKTEISDKAKVCPKCGAPVKKSGIGCGGILFGAFVIFIILVAAISSSKTEPHVQKTLKFEVRRRDSSIVITNVGSADVSGKNITLYINGMPPFTYKVDWTAPPLGESSEVPLRLFMEKDGTRFNPDAQGVTEIWMGGAGYDYEQRKWR